MALSKAGSDRPTGFGIAIDRMLGAIIKLFPIRGGFGEEQIGVRGRRADFGSSTERELVENKIAGLRPAAWAVLWQAWVRQDLEQDCGNALQAGLRLDGDGVVNRVQSGAQH